MFIYFWFWDEATFNLILYWILIKCFNRKATSKFVTDFYMQLTSIKSLQYIDFTAFSIGFQHILSFAYIVARAVFLKTLFNNISTHVFFCAKFTLVIFFKNFQIVKIYLSQKTFLKHLRFCKIL